MPTDRSVTVRLKIDNSDFLRGIAQSAAAAKALERQLSGTTDRFDRAMGRSSGNLDHFGDQINDTSGKVLFLGKGVGDTSHAIHELSGETDDAAKSMAVLGKSTDKAGAAFKNSNRDSRGFFASLNTGNDRMSFLVQTSLALGPALIPALAAAVPAVVGFGAALGFAATAAGVGFLAFQGVGDALKKLNDAALDPTEAHLKALKIAMEKLGPAGRDFVRFLQDARPEMQKLQDIAQEGLLPGVQEGITSLLTQMPVLEQVVQTIAETLGDITAATGEAFTSPFWTQFFNFLNTEARQTLTDFASGIGHLIEGISALIQAFQPLTDDFISGFDDMAQSFSAWAQNLDQTQGFADFVDFIRTAGPEFLDVIGALSKALVALGQAGADVGLASLEVLQRALEGLAVVLSSPIGPPLLAIAAAVSALSRSMALARIVGGSTLLTGLATGLAGLGAGTAAGSGLATINTMASIPYARIGAGIGLLALNFTDLGKAVDSAGLSNAANFGLAGGVVGGGIGAAIGVTIGLVVDAVHANDDLEDSIKRVQDAFDEGTWADQSAALDDLREKAAALNAEVEKQSKDERAGGFFAGLFDFDTQSPGDVLNRARELLGLDTMQDDANEAVDIAEATRDKIRATFEDLPQNPFGSIFDIAGVAGDIPDWITPLIAQLDSAPARADAFTRAVLGLNDASLITADSAEALALALDNLLNPNLNLQAATDAFTSSLHRLEDDIAKNSRVLDDNSEAAIKNRAALASRVVGMIDQLKAEAAVGESSQKFTKSLVDQRQRLIDVFKAAGFAGDEVRAMIKTLGLTPKQIQILIDANKEAFDKKHDQVVRDAGNLDSLNPVINIDANTTPAEAAIARIRAALQALVAAPFTATVGVSSSGPGGSAGTRRKAAGGEISGPGGPRSDVIPILASNGEFIVNAAAAQENLELLRRINASKFAAGGPVGFAAGGQVLNAGDISRRAFHSDDPRVILDLVEALKLLRQEAKDVTEAEEDVRAAREASREAARQLRQVEDTSSQKYRDRAAAQKAADKDLEQAEKDLAKQREELSKATAKWKDIQAQLIEQARAVQAGILGAGAIFGGEGTSVSVGGILAKMRQAAKDGREFNRNIAKIRAMGIPESIVQQLLEAAGTPGGNAAAENLANASRKQIEQLQRSSRHLANVSQASGRLAVVNGGGGNSINVRFTGPITTTDVTRLDERIERRIRRAVRVATGG